MVTRGATRFLVWSIKSPAMISFCILKIHMCVIPSFTSLLLESIYESRDESRGLSIILMDESPFPGQLPLLFKLVGLVAQSIKRNCRVRYQGHMPHHHPPPKEFLAAVEILGATWSRRLSHPKRLGPGNWKYLVGKRVFNKRYVLVEVGMEEQCRKFPSGIGCHWIESFFSKHHVHRLNTLLPP